MGIARKAACKNQSENGDIDRISWPTRRRDESNDSSRETAVNLLIALCPLAIIPGPEPDQPEVLRLVDPFAPPLLRLLWWPLCSI